MTRRKVVLIGAGSAMFTQGLVADLILTGQPWSLALVDIDPGALAVAEGLCRRMVAARDADITVAGSLERRDLLAGADVVVTTIGVGSRRAWEADVFIPRQYGIFQPVGDTVMAGGISRALRMIPAMVAIAADVIRLCPQALFVNYANPMTANCWAVRRATGADVIGLCHGVFHVQRELAEFIGVAPDEVTCQAVGLNHFTWIYDLRRNGADAWPLVRERLAAEAGGEVMGKPPRRRQPLLLVPLRCLRRIPGRQRPARHRVLPGALPRRRVLWQDAGRGRVLVRAHDRSWRRDLRADGRASRR